MHCVVGVFQEVPSPLSRENCATILRENSPQRSVASERSSECSSVSEGESTISQTFRCGWSVCLFLFEGGVSGKMETASVCVCLCLPVCICFSLKVTFLAKTTVYLPICVCLCPPVCVCFCLKVMFLAKGTVSLFTCLCLFLFKGDVSGSGDSQSINLSVSVSV